MTRPPVGLSGSSSGRTTCWPEVSCDRVGLLADRPAGDGDRVAVKHAGLVESLGQNADAAGLVEVLGDEAAARLQVAEQRGPLGDPVEVVDGQLDAGLVGDGEQVEDAVGRATRHADGRDRVLDRVLGDDLARAQIVGEHLHDQLAALARHLLAGVRRPRAPCWIPSG